MRKPPLYVGCLLALLTATGLAAEEKAAKEVPPTAPSGDTTIATVNGQALPLDLFRLFYAERLHQTNQKNSPALQNQVFNEFINVVVTAQDAEHKGLEKQDNVRLALELQRLQLLSRVALQAVAQTEPPTDAELKKAYDARYGNDQRTEYKARHILVKTEDEANKVIKELEGGADFADLAKASSLGPTGTKGGELGWFDAAQMVPPFIQAVAALKPGEYTKKPVQTQFGWHVILLEETREAAPPALEDVKGELTAQIQREKLSKYVAEIRNKTDLKLNTDLIKTTPPEQEKSTATKPEGSK
ncbi:MAG: peptidyl-prolyl cis-trans isomerase [Chromatiaceae bacterium]